MKFEPTLGNDPERFISRKGVIICPNEIIPFPKRVIPCGKYGGMNRDGMALELNPSPSTDIQKVAENTYLLLEDAIYEANAIGAVLSDSIKTVVEDFTGLPVDVQTIGCEPDMNAYTGKMNTLTEEQLHMKERYAGGHIHMGNLPVLDLEAHCNLVKAFDASAGLISVLWSTPESLERRAQYGRAGAFRRKKTLVEYRVPDANWTFKRGRFEVLCKAMVKAALDFNPLKYVPILPEEDVIGAINNCDTKEAMRMLKSTGLEVE